jgi:DNA uptake protein ComE-like DNA-binding protein
VVLCVIGLLLLSVAMVRLYGGAVRRQYSLRALEAPLVDLNQAGLAELLDLPGIEHALAERILRERENRGPYRSGEDLVRRVRGVGNKTLAALLEHSYISG